MSESELIVWNYCKGNTATNYTGLPQARISADSLTTGLCAWDAIMCQDDKSCIAANMLCIINIYEST